MKRILDVLLSAAGLAFAAPVLLPVMFLIWRQDHASPFYIAPRVGRDGRLFRMVKLRSMVANADRTGIDSTAGTDSRITPIGHFVRRYKLDELTQLWNVLIGDMSLVGPRPNVRRETDLYTAAEQLMLTVRPGITDFASIVFADEGEILKDKADPDIAYNQLIRPWKSRLAIFYVQNRTLMLDLQLMCLTVLSFVSRPAALARVQNLLRRMGAPAELVRIAARDQLLVPHPPPGMTDIVTSRG